MRWRSARTSNDVHNLAEDLIAFRRVYLIFFSLLQLSFNNNGAQCCAAVMVEIAVRGGGGQMVG